MFPVTSDGRDIYLHINCDGTFCAQQPDWHKNLEVKSESATAVDSGCDGKPEVLV